ncbi:PopZ family protein [Microvirga makkahensis]|uniref:DUF2497 domain-containing protein n=1 Tax=Microvirga makkahensis TaxID=1128670 RepID=A0A7X3MQ28_9HYPH|nr:DUF2497 domain-containing protein [Microvirga makkahensis]MXQ11108.1 DUF2497 domain-containing protein [Microvirga makkahensis]
MGSTNLKVNEPSMEDILASIRRIISEDPEPDSGESEPSPLRTVLDIAERHLTGNLHPDTQPGSSVEEMPLLQDDPFRERSTAHPAESYESAEAVRSPASARPQPAQAFTRPCERSPGEALMSPSTEASVAESFGRLDAARALGRSPTVEELLKEMLRPMLKAWLDDHLPTLVERLVRDEIARVTRG